MSTRRRSGTASASGSSSPTAQRRPPAALPPIQAPPRSTSNPHLPHYPREIIALATVRPPPPHVRSLPVNLMDEPPSYAESASTSTAVTPRLTFHRRRSRTNSVEFAAPPAGFIFTPAHTPPDPETSASPPELHRSQKSVSSPHLHRDGASSLTPMFDARRARLSAQNSDEDDDGIVFTAISQGARASGNLRARMVRGVRSRDRLKQITTAPGLRGAGETETEAEDPVSPWMQSLPPNLAQCMSSLQLALSSAYGTNRSRVRTTHSANQRYRDSLFLLSSLSHRPCGIWHAI